MIADGWNDNTGGCLVRQAPRSAILARSQDASRFRAHFTRDSVRSLTEVVSAVQIQVQCGSCLAFSVQAFAAALRPLPSLCARLPHIGTTKLVPRTTGRAPAGAQRRLLVAPVHAQPTLTSPLRCASAVAFSHGASRWGFDRKDHTIKGERKPV